MAIMSSPLALTLDPADPSVRAAAQDLVARLDDDSEVAHAVKTLLADVAGGSRVLVLRAEDEVTPAQAAAIIGVTRQFIDRLCADGVLAFRRLPGSRHRRIRTQDVVDVATEREARRTGNAVLRAAMNATHA